MQHGGKVLSINVGIVAAHHRVTEEMSAYSCLRCGRPIDRPNKSFCSDQCRLLSLEELGPPGNPVQNRLYDYSNYDPEDEIYGDYDIDPDQPAK